MRYVRIRPSTAAVGGATVIVENTGTGVVTRTATTETGYYSATNLIPGVYSVTVEAPGFKKAVRGDVTLNVNQTATLNFRLELGAVTQEVTVNAEAPMLDQSTGPASWCP